MKTPEVERITVRKLMQPVKGFRYAAAPHLKGGVHTSKVPLGEYLGVTQDEAREKAEKAVMAWRKRH